MGGVRENLRFSPLSLRRLDRVSFRNSCFALITPRYSIKSWTAGGGSSKSKRRKGDKTLWQMWKWCVIWCITNSRLEKGLLTRRRKHGQYGGSRMPSSNSYWNTMSKRKPPQKPRQRRQPMTIILSPLQARWNWNDRARAQEEKEEAAIYCLGRA